MATIRLPVVVAAFAALSVVGCSMPQSSSPGTAPTATSSPGYIVPQGYVSGQNIIPYAGRIATKCEHHTSEQARKGCIAVGG